MKKRSDKIAILTLRDAYKVSGFRVRARIDGSEDLQPPVFVLTLDRHAKKRCVVDAGTFAVVFTANVGDGCGISVVEIGKSIWTFPCAV